MNLDLATLVELADAEAEDYLDFRLQIIDEWGNTHAIVAIDLSIETGDLTLVIN
jgi:hypothetical protein